MNSRHYRERIAECEYTSPTTNLDDAGAMVVMDADGAIRDDRLDVTEEVGDSRTRKAA